MQNKEATSAEPDNVRATLADLINQRGESLGALSRMIGRNDAYLQQFIRRGTPRRLDEDARLKLAKVLKVDERLLGARDPWQPE
ncbi:hypothetical protein [Sphingomonas sp. BAUL-RG-20F-R05-02]|uniref:hypothetical protein n=1 Tax=Sphingomonas sp. BAUL-RG-20F-R05-02 TaxID=2914830 RepID=UPI001F5A929C|nr:hypothetical protein [Sphingomonas sp. BAUL-RG-20F-R05-02]